MCYEQELHLFKAQKRVEFAVHLAVACDVYDGVFCAVLFPTRCLG